MQIFFDFLIIVDFGNNFVNYIEVNLDDFFFVVESGSGVVVVGVLVKDGQQMIERLQNFVLEEELNQQQLKVSFRDCLLVELFVYKILRYFFDFDLQEDVLQYNIVCLVIEKFFMLLVFFGFLGKLILNVVMLIKDDNSVLNMLNYMVLNYLVMSSIKNNILVVLVMMRYKSKVCLFCSNKSFVDGKLICINQYVIMIMYKFMMIEGIQIFFFFYMI